MEKYINALKEWRTFVAAFFKAFVRVILERERKRATEKKEQDDRERVRVSSFS